MTPGSGRPSAASSRRPTPSERPWYSFAREAPRQRGLFLSAGVGLPWWGRTRRGRTWAHRWGLTGAIASSGQMEPSLMTLNRTAPAWILPRLGLRWSLLRQHYPDRRRIVFWDNELHFGLILVFECAESLQG